VDDTLGRSATLRGYESMTSISSGSGGFPTVGQLSAGVSCHKSNTADSGQRAWQFVSNGKIFYLFAYNSGTSQTSGIAFGDFVSYKAADAFNTVMFGDSSTNAGTSSVAFGYNATTTIGSTTNGEFIARAYTQLGTWGLYSHERLGLFWRRRSYVPERHHRRAGCVTGVCR
jgi:hypothetical protein